MKRLLVVGEDSLCAALGVRLVRECLGGWAASQPAIDCKGVTNLVAALPRYCEQAQHVQPVVCIADSDGRCAVALLEKWLPRGPPPGLLLRLAVTEAESWLLADHEGFSSSFAVSAKALPRQPDEERNPKSVLLNLAWRSRTRAIREEVVSEVDRNRRGSGYNQHLRTFVEQAWDIRRAAARSPSLSRAIQRLESWSASRRA